MDKALYCQIDSGFKPRQFVFGNNDFTFDRREAGCTKQFKKEEVLRGGEIKEYCVF
jgi:hypothetical protein